MYVLTRKYTISGNTKTFQVFTSVFYKLSLVYKICTFYHKDENLDQKYLQRFGETK